MTPCIISVVLAIALSYCVYKMIYSTHPDDTVWLIGSVCCVMGLIGTFGVMFK